MNVQIRVEWELDTLDSTAYSCLRDLVEDRYLISRNVNGDSVADSSELLRLIVSRIERDHVVDWSSCKA